MIHPPSWIGDGSLIFLSLLVQGVPFLLAGALLGGVITALVPVQTLAGKWPSHPALSTLCGASCGLLLPACDCAVVPVVRRLVQRGIPLSAGVAYLLAAPVLNPICLLSTYLAFRMNAPWPAVALRAGGGFLLAVLLGLLASRFSAEKILRGEVLVESATGAGLPVQPRAGGGPRRRRAALALGTTLRDFLDVTTLYVLGAICSALLQTFLPLGALILTRGMLGPLSAVALAFLLSLCSSADAFVVNGFGSLGLSGQMAFLWLGPIYNVRALFVYRNVFQARAIAVAGGAIVLLILTLSATLKLAHR
jgi:uncharacterized membrane protein YraQ (UPF0718 family)